MRNRTAFTRERTIYHIAIQTNSEILTNKRETDCPNFCVILTLIPKKNFRF